MSKATLRVHCDHTAITRRARQIVEKIHISGIDHQEIARLTDTTVLSLLNGASPQLRKPQFKALATHFDVSLLYLWTGIGPEFIKPQDKNFTTS